MSADLHGLLPPEESLNWKDLYPSLIHILKHTFSRYYKTFNTTFLYRNFIGERRGQPLEHNSLHLLILQNLIFTKNLNFQLISVNRQKL